MKTNVYDFDKTIYDGDSSKDFYLFCLKENKKIILRLPLFLMYVILYIFKIITKEKLKENYFSFLKDMKNINKLVEKFWKINENKIKDFYKKTSHKNDIIISASPYFLLKPICNKLKVKDLIATNVDKHTGKFDGKNCYGEEKIKRLKQKYKNIIIDNFYTDSLSDISLINISNKSYIVNKNKIIEYKEKKEKKIYEKVLNILYSSSNYLLISLTLLLIIVSLFWVFRLSLFKLSFIISFIIGGFIWNKFDKNKKKSKLISLIVSFLVLTLSVCIAGSIYDQSYDGNAYHKETIYMLKEGWNPVYDDLKEYALKNNDEVKQNPIWAEHYTKTSWILGATIYDITGNIETSKFFNIIFIYITFGNVCYISYKLFSKKIFSIIISFVLVANPIMVEQVSTLYIDGFLGLLLYLSIIYMYLFIKNEHDNYIKLILGTIIIIISNIKFTGLAYCGVFCLGYYIYYLVEKIKKHHFKCLIKNTLYFVVVVLISVLIVGSNSYLKNTIEHKNPFYPLAGEGKVDIMTNFQPVMFTNMSPIERNFYSIFSKSGYVSRTSYKQPELKIPFTFDINEIRAISYDTRMGGFGVLFSGILIIAIVLIIVFTISSIRKKEKSIVYNLIPLGVSILLLLFLPDSWWPRYSPYLYLFVVVALLLSNKNQNKYFRVFMLFYIGIIILNSALCFGSFNYYTLRSSILVREELNNNQNKKIDIYLPETTYGVLANLKEKNIKYNIVTTKTENMQPLYGNYIYYEKIESIE